MGKEYQVRNGSLVDITPKVSAIVGRNVGELVHSIVPLVDANLHLLDGTQLQDDGIYADGIAKIKALQASYPGLFTTEADWQASVTQYDACGKFVIGDGTLRLPKITKFIEGTTDATALGDLVEAGLPNITGTGPVLCTPYTDTAGPTGAGAVTVPSKVKNLAIAGGSSNWRSNFGIDASLSNAIYGNSTTVQPQSIKGFFYIVLGTFPKSSAVVDMDNIATDLNGKADVDITNLTNAGKAALAHAAMPSKTTKTLANPSASGQAYTMEADGYFTVYGVTTAANGYIQLERNGIKPTISIAPLSGYGVSVEVPVSAGDIVKINYSNVSSFEVKFIYCNGNAHLAS